MTITFFKKNNNPKLELVRDLIDELDELYSDYSDISIEDRDLIAPTVDYSGNERYYKRFEEINAKIYIREKNNRTIIMSTITTKIFKFTKLKRLVKHYYIDYIKYTKKDLYIPRSEYEKEVIGICRRITQNPRSELLTCPQTGKRYIKK